MSNELAKVHPYYDEKHKRWIVECVCGALMIPVLLPYPEYLRDCPLTNCENCNKDRFNGAYGAFYSCSRQGCDCLHSAHRNGNRVGKPLGIPSSDECSMWRHLLHIVMDPIWTNEMPTGKGNRIWTRSRLYYWLARRMNLPTHETHGSLFNIDQCAQAITHLQKLRARLGMSDILK